MAHLVVEVDDGRHVAAASTTFGEVLERWLETKGASVEATTLASYRWIATTYVSPLLGATPLSASQRPRAGWQLRQPADCRSGSGVTGSAHR